jgi:hypothetical protein
MISRAVIAAATLLCGSLSGFAAETITRGNNLAVDAAEDGRLLMDLAGDLWVVPPGGGEAQPIYAGGSPIKRPRWSPDGTKVVYASEDERALNILEPGTGNTRTIVNGRFLDLHPSWHPAGERVVFSSERRDTGLDLWEVDVATGLQWRLSDRGGDETEPAWSADGRNLIYIHRESDRWSLVLRMHGQPEEILVSGNDRLSGPSWRPDGSLIMFWRETEDSVSLDMIILSQPRLVRRYADGEDFTKAPVSWLDKQQMFYTAGGVIRQRQFNSWSSKTVPFRAMIEATPEQTVERVRRSLSWKNEPAGKLVVHAERLFDGIGSSYQHDRDILIEGGRIVSVEAHAERPGYIVIDMGDLVVVPGLVDVQAELPPGTDESAGPLLLAAGVTTVVARHAEAEHLDMVWSGKELPGPRLLPAEDWEPGEFSGLADSQLPGLDELLASRTAQQLNLDIRVSRRFSEPPVIDHGKTDRVLGSQPNGMPAGIGTQAELRALVSAGLSAEQALRAAGVNAAAALGVDPKLGRVATGASADLLFIDGNPLDDISDTLQVVAVVRNGRFFSVAGLIDRAAAAKDVD